MARILAYKEFYFVLLINSFIVLSEKLLKHLSGMIATTFRARYLRRLLRNGPETMFENVGFRSRRSRVHGSRKRTRLLGFL